MANLLLSVQGLSCKNCASKIKRALMSDGATQVDVDMTTGQVKVTDTTLNPLQAKQKIEALETKFKVTKFEIQST